MSDITLPALKQTDGLLPDLRKYEEEIEQAIETCNEQNAQGTNLPWCLYDLAQIHFLRGEMEEFESVLNRAIKASTAKWQVETAHETYTLLKKANIPDDNVKSAVKSAIEKFEKLVEDSAWE